MLCITFVCCSFRSWHCCVWRRTHPEERWISRFQGNESNRHHEAHRPYWYTTTEQSRGMYVNSSLLMPYNHPVCRHPSTYWLIMINFGHEDHISFTKPPLYALFKGYVAFFPVCLHWEIQQCVISTERLRFTWTSSTIRKLYSLNFVFLYWPRKFNPLRIQLVINKIYSVPCVHFVPVLYPCRFGAVAFSGYCISLLIFFI